MRSVDRRDSNRNKKDLVIIVVRNGSMKRSRLLQRCGSVIVGEGVMVSELERVWWCQSWRGCGGVRVGEGVVVS